MSTAEIKTLPAPPNLVSSLLTGFDAVANHIGLLIFPVVLDLFLWFGPRLRLETLRKQIEPLLSNLPSGSAQTADILELTEGFWTFIGMRFNLFSVLRTYPVGIPSLVSGTQPLTTPVGSPTVWQPSMFAVVLVWWVLLNLVGLVFGSLYFLAVSQAVLEGEVKWSRALQRWPWATAQTLFLALLWAAILLGVSLPASCILSVFASTGMPGGEFGLLLLGGLVFWILFPLLFSPHGIYVNRSPMFASVFESTRIIRLTMPKTALLFIFMLLISEGLGLVWRLPAGDSWMAIVGVIGHAFVATGLLAATFVYYRDASRWVRRLIQQAKFATLT